MKQSTQKKLNSSTRFIALLAITIIIISLLVIIGISRGFAQSDSESFFKGLLEIQTFAGILGYKEMIVKTTTNGDELRIIIPPVKIVYGNRTELELSSLAGIQRLSISLKAETVLSGSYSELKPIKGEIIYEITLLK